MRLVLYVAQTLVKIQLVKMEGDAYGLDSGLRYCSPYAIVHLNFSHVVKISPKAASTTEIVRPKDTFKISSPATRKVNKQNKTHALVFPVSRLATLAIASISLTHHSSKLLKTLLRSAKEVSDHLR